MSDLRKLRLDELKRVNVLTYRQQAKIPIIVILDNIRSGMNVGSIFRTCDAFAIERVYLCGITATPPHKEILKTAIGATNSVEWSYHASVHHVAEALQSDGYQLIGIEQTNRSRSLSATAVEGSHKYAIFLGNEVDGLSDELLPLLDEAVEIPQYGTKHSLNVAVCAGIVIWHFAQSLIDAR